MRWEKLSQSCQAIIAWVFLFFVVGTFMALIIMKVSRNIYLVPTYHFFLFSTEKEHAEGHSPQACSPKGLLWVG